MIRDIVEDIKRKTILTVPNLEHPFKLHTDASDKAIGAVLSQQNKTIGIVAILLIE